MNNSALLSEILGYNVLILEGNTSLNPDGQAIVYRVNNQRGKIGSININKFVFKVIDWIMTNRYEFTIYTTQQLCSLVIYKQPYSVPHTIKGKITIEVILKAIEWVFKEIQERGTQSQMTEEKFNETSKCCCGWYTEPFEGVLVWCAHPDNKNQLEGNCQMDDCPIKDNIKELAEARKVL